MSKFELIKDGDTISCVLRDYDDEDGLWSGNDAVPHWFPDEDYPVWVNSWENSWGYIGVEVMVSGKDVAYTYKGGIEIKKKDIVFLSRKPNI